MTEEKLANALNEGRMISAVDNIIFPLIDKFIQDRTMLMTGRFRSGDTQNIIADTAYITALQDLSVELKRIQVTGNKAYKELNDKN